MELCAAGAEEYERRSDRSSESSGEHLGCDLYLWNVLPVRTDQCAVTEDVNLSWEGGILEKLKEMLEEYLKKTELASQHDMDAF